MKNIQIIDGALNCAYDIFACSDKTFALIFPGKGQDIEFIEDFIKRSGDHQIGKIMKPVWRKRVDKKKVHGLHGTLFYGLAEKKPFYPTKREIDLKEGHGTRAFLRETSSIKRGSRTTGTR